MVCVAIVGTGDHAHGLAHLFSVNNAVPSNTMLVTKPGISVGGTLHDTNVPLVEFEEGLSRCNIVIIAIPPHALLKFTEKHLDLIKDKIVVDATNSQVRGEDLLSILALTPILSVKAFNDIGAVETLLDKPSNKRKMLTQMCSKHPKALHMVQTFAQESLGLDVKVVPYEKYHQLSHSQTRLDDPWVTSILLMLSLFVLTLFYAVLRYNVYKGYSWFHLPLQVTNKAICWTSLNGMAVSQLPGVLARMWNEWSVDSLRSKPKSLKKFLELRKHLGLISLWFLLVHILMSLILFSPAYYGKFYVDKTAVAPKMNSIGENSLLFAVLGTSLYAIMGVCSLPSVGYQMNRVQWELVYGPVAWIALVFGTVHVLIMGVKGWTATEKWPGGMPPITMTSVLIPLLILAMKLCQIVLSRWNRWVVHPIDYNDARKLIPTSLAYKSHPIDEKEESFRTVHSTSDAQIPQPDNGLVHFATEQDQSIDTISEPMNGPECV